MFETHALQGRASVNVCFSYLQPCVHLLKCSSPSSLRSHLLRAAMDEERRGTPGRPDVGPALPPSKIVELMIQCLLHLVQAMVLYQEQMLPQQRHGESNNANANAASSGSVDRQSQVLGFDFDVIERALRSRGTGSNLAEHPRPTSSNAPTERADSTFDDMVKKIEEEDEDYNQPIMSEVTHDYEPSVEWSAGVAPSAASGGEESDLSLAPEHQSVTPLPVPSEKMSPRARSRSPRT